MMTERTDFNGSNTQKRSKSPCSFQKTGCSFHSFEQILSKRAKNKSPKNLDFSGFFGGELGIRTLGTFLYTAFRVLHLRPLGQLSICQSENHFQNFWKELTERTPILFSFRTVKPRINTGFLADKTYTASKNFESAPL